MRTDTVKVDNPNEKGGHMIINKSDYDADQAEGGKKLYKLHKEVEKEHANDGIIEGHPVTQATSTRNPSGTYAEPTPTDIRYPIDATEFENNHGAFVGQSAAGIRDELDMEDKPGGLDPEKHERIQQNFKEQVAEAERGPTEGAGARLQRRRALSGQAAEDGKDKGHPKPGETAPAKSGTDTAKK